MRMALLATSYLLCKSLFLYSPIEFTIKSLLSIRNLFSFPFKVATKENLSWLKQIKKSQGSVTLTTMVQVEAINSSGIYHVSVIQNNENKSIDTEIELCLENLVYLVVPENESKNRKNKKYSLEEIKNVQSKLMLIAGRAESGKEEFDRFEEVCMHCCL